MKDAKNTFQNIHYNRQKPSFCLKVALGVGEFFYKKVINLKNFLYEINFLKEQKTDSYVICVGNLTTGGVGKTPIVIDLANELAKKENIAIISRGYKSKLSKKEAHIIKDFKELKFKNGSLCGDEPYQLAKKVKNNVVVITCPNRKKAIDLARIKFGIKTVVLDDGFSNRKVKKDKTILVIDSKMRFGNEHLLPFGPLREPISEIKRTDEIILVNKGDENIDEARLWVEKFDKPFKIATFEPKSIYNLQSKAQVVNPKKQKAVAFCAIGQPSQFFDFAKRYYNLAETVSFDDHHGYTKKDIKELIKVAKMNKTNIFITTQKDEAKLKCLVDDVSGYSFNVMELGVRIEEQ